MCSNACYDLGAAEFGIGRDEIRRRNYIRPEQIPYTNVVGNAIDSGLFAETQGKAQALADWAGFPARRAASAAQGKRRGIGLGYFIEASGGQPSEWARVRFDADGSIAVTVGTFSHGQGHETAYAQILHQKLGVDFDAVRLIQGDTDVVEKGNGTGGSRSSQMGGVAIARASELVIAKGRRLAAHLLEAGVDDVEFETGRFRVAGTDLSTGWEQVIELAQSPPEGEAPGLDEQLLYTRSTECNSRTAATSPRWRSTPIPARSRSSATPRWTMSATSSTPCWCTASRMAASCPASARRCWNTRSTTRRAASS